MPIPNSIRIPVENDLGTSEEQKEVVVDRSLSVTRFWCEMPSKQEINAVASTEINDVFETVTYFGLWSSTEMSAELKASLQIQLGRARSCDWISDCGALPNLKQLEMQNKQHLCVYVKLSSIKCN